MRGSGVVPASGAGRMGAAVLTARGVRAVEGRAAAFVDFVTGRRCLAISAVRTLNIALEAGVR